MSSNSIIVLRLSACELTTLENLLRRYRLVMTVVPDGQSIPGSYWGQEEAGLQADRLLARLDTPVHSVLHEAGHYVCMDSLRRSALDTDAGGNYEEENAVCYLQALLAADLPGVGQDRMFRDMDAWGYSFRLGSARQWFEQDAGDAQSWLQKHDLIGPDNRPTYRLREK